MNKQEIQDKVKVLENIIKELDQTAKKQFKPEDCPLNTNDMAHYVKSNALFGATSWRWSCRFCGKHF